MQTKFLLYTWNSTVAYHIHYDLTLSLNSIVTEETPGSVIIFSKQSVSFSQSLLSNCDARELVKIFELGDH